MKIANIATSITDQFVWNLVIDTVSNSSVLREAVKDEVLQEKFKGDAENDRLLQNQKTKTTRLMKELKQLQSTIADVETNQLLKKYDDAEVYLKIKANLDAEFKKIKDDIEQTRIRTKELGNQKKWLNWIEKYGDDLELMHDLSNEDQKEYLEGLLEKIEVRLDKDTNDHHLDIIFKMGLVNDRIEYTNPKRKSGGYRVVEGDKNAKLVISHEQTRKMHKDARIAGRRKQNEKKIPEK